MYRAELFACVWSLSVPGGFWDETQVIPTDFSLLSVVIQKNLVLTVFVMYIVVLCKCSLYALFFPYLRDRRNRWKRSSLPVHFPGTYIGQGGNQEPENVSQVPLLGDRDPIPQAVTCCLPESLLAGSCQLQVRASNWTEALQYGTQDILTRSQKFTFIL